MIGLRLPDRARWLLEACLRDDGRAVEAFGKWRRFANPDRMEGRELRLTPLLHENMRRLGLSDQRLAWIGGQAKHIWLSSVLRRRKLLPILDALEGAGVDFVVIKGWAMSARFPKAVGPGRWAISTCLFTGLRLARLWRSSTRLAGAERLGRRSRTPTSTAITQ